MLRRAASSIAGRATSELPAPSVEAWVAFTAKDGTTAGSGEPPKELVCPILHALMTDPVSTVDGHTFERQAIAKWLEQHSTSPLSDVTRKLPSISYVRRHIMILLGMNLTLLCTM